MGGRSAVGLAAVLWVSVIAGAGLAPRLGAHGGVGVLAALAAALAFALVAARGGRRSGGAALVLVAGAFGAARGLASAASLEHDRAAIDAVMGVHATVGDVDDEAGAAWLRLRVIDHPWRESGRPGVAALVDSGPARGAHVRVWLPPDCQAEWGDRLIALARLERPPGVRVPGGFNAAAAAGASGIAAQGRALAVRVTPAEGAWALPRATVVRWRRAIERVLARSLSPGARELATPLVDGDRSALTPMLGAHLQTAGLTHLLALSGMHVVWLAGVVRVLAAGFGAGFAVRQVLGAACAALYLGIAGPLPSLARAAVTEALLAAARLRGRALDPVQALAITVLLLLAAAPEWASDLGFQLSCTASLGLVTYGAPLERIAHAAPRVVRPLLAGLTPTLAAQALALPILLDHFHALPWTTFAANLVAVPVSGALLAGAWLGAALDLAAPGAGHLPLAACEPLAAGLRAIADLAARAPLALWPTGSEPGVPWLAGTGAVLLAWACAGPRDLAGRQAGPAPARVRAALLGALALATALGLAITARPLRPPPGTYWMVAIDVGQGDAIALAFPDGWWLVDAGPRTQSADAGLRAVLPFLRRCGVRRLERLVLTHDDADHTGGATAVREGVPVIATLAAVSVPGAPGPGGRFAARRVAAGDTLRRAPAVAVLWPPRGVPARGDNAASVVLAIGDNASLALLTADADSTVEAAVASRVAGPIAVLKVGHHGSASSSGIAFLRRVRPRIAVISCGVHDPFGHPHPAALVRLRASGAVLRRTDRTGTVWLEIGENGARDVDWRHRSAVAIAPAPPAPDPSATSGSVPEIDPLACAWGAVAHPWTRW